MTIVPRGPVTEWDPQREVTTAAPERMARSIEQLLPRSEILSEMRSAGLSFAVTGEENSVDAVTVAPPGRQWPTFRARITGVRWWDPESSEHTSRVATRLAAELRMKWERWVGGGHDPEEPA